MMFGAARAASSLALALGARDDHGHDRVFARKPVDDPGVERVRGVVGRGLRRRANDHQHMLAIDADLAEDGGIGFEVRQVVVLL